MKSESMLYMKSFLLSISFLGCEVLPFSLNALVNKHKESGQSHGDFMISKQNKFSPAFIGYLKMSQIDDNIKDNSYGTEFVKADDGDALQILFGKQCDEDGLMTKKTLVSIPAIADLLAAGDLLQEELDDIWKTAPKFPDLESSATQRIDVDSFIQIYRDIDAIFEDEDDIVPTTKLTETNDTGSSIPETNHKREESNGGSREMEELELTFETLCDESRLITKASMRNWSEIKELIVDNMLGEDEFDEIWERTVKGKQIDFDSFVQFNNALDELFVFDDEDAGNDNQATTSYQREESSTSQLVYGENPSEIFSALADDDFLIGIKELERWGDVQDMIADGELIPIELQNLFENVPKALGSDEKINEEGFKILLKEIDALFEDDNDVEEQSEQLNAKIKSDLLDLLEFLQQDEERMPCGLEGTDIEAEQVTNLVTQMESMTLNKVVSSGGEIKPADVDGDWELLYTTSSTMKFNKGLSGLVPPNGKFGSLQQKLTASKYLADVEYVEYINAGPASFDVRVTGDWELRSSVSLFTGSRSVVLSVEPDKVNYGLNSQKADHWKSLGPMNLLDIAYIDNELRIMRGADSIFIFKRVT
mmetsp:Transcript_9282/g.11725  ORF Transcript_9282/g.11725 Transcript_9282/m.11725 type:complete len:593 (-) Transcript_9282:76-1854(-)